MAALGSKLRSLEGGLVSFWCPGCNESHAIRVQQGVHPCWTFNGNGDRPTFKPSVLVRSGHFASEHKAGDECWCTYNAAHPDDISFTCSVCHSFVTDGQIQFLADSTHELAGKTVPLPDWTAQEIS